MTQQPFTRHGAIDLSGLRQPPASAAGAPVAGAPAPGAELAYAVEVTDANFQAILEASLNAPVVLAAISPSRVPASAGFADDVRAAVEAYDGRFLAAILDIDAVPSVAAALQVSQVPLTYVLLDARPAMQPIPGVLQPEELSLVLQQLGQQLTAQGIAGRHKPHALGAGSGAVGEAEEPGLDPRYAPAQDALAAGDIDTAVAEYQRLVDANPADAEAAAGLAMAKVLQRTQGVDGSAARAAADAAPDDVAVQTLAADLDLVDGDVAGAFARLVETVRRTAGADRTQAREHLIGLFAAVGNEDERVRKARQDLTSALF